MIKNIQYIVSLMWRSSVSLCIPLSKLKTNQRMSWYEAACLILVDIRKSTKKRWLKSLKTHGFLALSQFYLLCDLDLGELLYLSDLLFPNLWNGNNNNNGSFLLGLWKPWPWHSWKGLRIEWANAGRVLTSVPCTYLGGPMLLCLLYPSGCQPCWPSWRHMGLPGLPITQYVPNLLHFWKLTPAYKVVL